MLRRLLEEFVMAMNNFTLKNNILLARKRAHLSQEEIASQLGISRQAYVRIEHGSTVLFHRCLFKIAKVCKTNLAQLIFGDEYIKDCEELRSELVEAKKQIDFLMCENVLYKERNRGNEIMIDSLNREIHNLTLISNYLTREVENLTDALHMGLSNFSSQQTNSQK